MTKEKEYEIETLTPGGIDILIQYDTLTIPCKASHMDTVSRAVASVFPEIKSAPKIVLLGDEEVDLSSSLAVVGIEEGARLEIQLIEMQISAAAFHSLMLVDGKVYSFGCGLDGQLGHGDDVDMLVPKPIESVLLGKRVVGVSAGTRHTVVWTDEGGVYSFGEGYHGQLGHGGTGHEFAPRRIEGVLMRERVIGATAGYAHTVAWTEKGKAYSFGAGTMAQLGHGGEDHAHAPRLIEGALKGKMVVGAAAGNVHTLVLTDEGKVYSFGYMGHGRLGHNVGGFEYLPRRILSVLKKKKIVGVSTGYAHTAVWTEGGDAYSFGVGISGRLGHGGERNELVPRLIEGLEGNSVVGLSAGEVHTVAWTAEGKAYSFGDGRFYKLGHGSEEQEFLPRLIEGELTGTNVFGVATGRRHTLVTTEEGNVYSFGDGYRGRLGHGREEIEPVPMLIDANPS